MSTQTRDTRGPPRTLRPVFRRPRIIAVSPEFHAHSPQRQVALKKAVVQSMSPAHGAMRSASGMTAALAITWCEERGEAYTVEAVPGQGYMVRRGVGATLVPSDDPETVDD